MTSQHTGSAGYDDLLSLFQQWRAFQAPALKDGVADYGAAAMEKQRTELPKWKTRLEAIPTNAWTVDQKIDAEIVRAEMNGLDFDHRVLKPWSSDPAFYRMLHDGETDVPRREGHTHPNSIEIWKYRFPLDAASLTDLTRQVSLIPAVLDQAKTNLAADSRNARDLWMLAARTKRDEVEMLQNLETQARTAGHDALAKAFADARAASEAFAVWIKDQIPKKTGKAGIGVADYDWHLRNVQLVPMSWAEEVALHERELGRAKAQLALMEFQNRNEPPMKTIDDPVAWDRASREGVEEFMRFLRTSDIMPVRDYFDQALMERRAPFVPPDRRDFFYQVEFRDPMVMRCHGTHWFDRALGIREPHASPIRRDASLYNLWVSRAEGLATATEEMLMSAGLFEKHPRAKELIYILVANRAARGLAGLKVQSGEFTIEQALHFAHENTPYGWLKVDGGTNWGEQELYLRQPFYGSSYLTGKALIEQLLAERHSQLGAAHSMKRFYTEFFDAGMIPVSMIRWKMTGRRFGE